MFAQSRRVLFKKPLIIILQILFIMSKKSHCNPVNP